MLRKKSGYYICGEIQKNNSFKKEAKLGIKAASSSEVSHERALANIGLNFRKSSRPPIGQFCIDFVFSY